MSDIVERLGHWIDRDSSPLDDDLREAADEITRLRAENERLETELAEWQEHANKKRLECERLRERVEELEGALGDVLRDDDGEPRLNDAPFWTDGFTPEDAYYEGREDGRKEASQAARRVLRGETDG